MKENSQIRNYIKRANRTTIQENQTPNKVKLNII